MDCRSSTYIARFMVHTPVRLSQFSTRCKVRLQNTWSGPAKNSSSDKTKRSLRLRNYFQHEFGWEQRRATELLFLLLTKIIKAMNSLGLFPRHSLPNSERKTHQLDAKRIGMVLFRQTGPVRFLLRASEMITPAWATHTQLLAIAWKTFHHTA